MGKIKCMIIDDAPFVVSVLEAYIREVETLELTATFYNAVDGLMYLQQNKIDLLFLDADLPKITGEGFMRLVPSRPKVVFLGPPRNSKMRPLDDYVLDYLVEPVAFEHFVACITKYYATVPVGTPWPTVLEPDQDLRGDEPFLYLKSEKNMIKVYLREILYAEGIRDFVKIKTTGHDVIIYQRMGYIQARLPKKHFIRIHRSFIVARNKITSFNDMMIQVNMHILPVSRQYRAKVMKALRTL
ncbi:LytR/AlgR family response regulator transcription factor [Dyadobacter sp. MSC1_007]|jgi:DNA-binding LytR/AlgR family response regulator|uniref:LytR/AlgR family response regulator transcription factor n=1 Tax=Dyadobacter sp. MSC1_007 TaxID=2909264 RepID=UPI00202FE5EF|nr:LytTR family DNA-binding domain-containing protein [Dyadobacter sp. MSC1_007]